MPKEDNAENFNQKISANEFAKTYFIWLFVKILSYLNKKKTRICPKRFAWTHFCGITWKLSTKIVEKRDSHIFNMRGKIWNRVEIFDWEKTNYFDQNLSLNNLDRKFIAWKDNLNAFNQNHVFCGQIRCCLSVVERFWKIYKILNENEH